MKAVGDWKVCGKCKGNKRLWDFGKNKTRRDGLADLCRQCHAGYGQANKANKIVNVRINGNKRCNKCQSAKHVSEFYHDATRKDGRTNYCKSCRSNLDKSYHQRMLETKPELHRERQRESNHDWYYKNQGWLVRKLYNQAKQQEMGR